MKKYFFTLLIFLISSRADADCLGCSTGLMWPLNKVIGTNAVFIFETDDTAVVKRLQQKKYYYLKPINGNTRIDLIVVEICKGLNIDQIILKPAIALPDGKEYGLYYVTAKSKGKTPKEVAIRTWLVKNAATSTPPVWLKQPVIQRKMFVAYGCGPLAKVFFSFNTDIPNTIIRAKVINKSNGRTQYCYLKSQNGIFDLGHDMCCGEFVFDDEYKRKDEYEVGFVLMDANGNTSATSNTISFIQPNPEDS